MSLCVCLSPWAPDSSDTQGISYISCISRSLHSTRYIFIPKNLHLKASLPETYILVEGHLCIAHFHERGGFDWKWFVPLEVFVCVLQTFRCSQWGWAVGGLLALQCTGQPPLLPKRHPAQSVSHAEVRKSHLEEKKPI